MSEKIKAKITLTLTQKEAEWLNDLLAVTKRNGKVDAQNAQKAGKPEDIELAWNIVNKADSLIDRLNSERWS